MDVATAAWMKSKEDSLPPNEMLSLLNPHQHDWYGKIERDAPESPRKFTLLALFDELLPENDE